MTPSASASSNANPVMLPTVAVTVQMNVWEPVPPIPSMAVTVTWYGPPSEAVGVSVPLMTPVVGLMPRPGGRLVAV